MKLYDEAVPDAVFDAVRFEAATASLWRTGAGAAVLDEVAVSPSGTFVFDEVPPGDYLVRAHVDGFRDGERTLRLDAGVRYDLGELPLPALASPDAVGTIAGVARRVDAPEDGHGGIRVQVLGTPWQAETEDAGHYRVVVAPGLYAVGFSADGYGSASVPAVRATPGETTTLDEVVLTARPGRIVGEIVLTSPDPARPFTEQDLLAVTLSLVDLDRDGIEARIGAPAADGRFSFDDIPSGHYALSADAPGFIGAQASVDVEAGRARNVGALSLQARIDARLFGIARRRCPLEPCGHGGILVETVGRPFVTVTGSDGRYLLSLTAGAHTLRYSLEGHAPVEVSTSVDVGERALDDVELVPLPSRIEGRILGEGGVPLAGASATVLRSGADGGAGTSVAEPVLSGPDGVVTFEVSLAADTYLLRVTRDQYGDVTLPLVLSPGRAARFGDVALALAPGRLAGRVTRSDGVARGAGVTLVVTGEPADPVTAGRTVRAVTSPPDDAFDLALPAGAWTVTPLAEDYRTPPATPVVVTAGETAEVALAVHRRVHRVDVPPVVGRVATARFIADPDLVFGRVWWEGDEPPPDLPFEPLSGEAADTLVVDVGAENRAYVLRFQLANEAHLLDPADPYGARTPVLTAATVVDTEPPRVTRVEVAGGAPEVHALIVPVVVDAMGAATLAVWNASDATCAGAPRCGTDALAPYGGTVVHTLDEARQGTPQAVCVLACDEVCNCAEPVAALTLLGTFRERPTPVLSTMTPSTIEVHHYEMVDDPAAPLEPARPRTLITLTRSGIAHDTVAVVDAIELPCERPLGVPGAEGCRADVEGTCDGECVIDLTRPEAGGLRDNAGTYAVRLRTPAPVQGGESLSEPLFLNVSTQLPIIESMSPRGLALADLSDPDLRGLIEDAEFDGTDFARVFPDHVEVALTVCRDADNAQFRLGPNVGRVLSSSRRVPVPVDAEGACAGLDARDVVVDFGTERLVGLDPADQAIGVVNPSPGDGVGTAPFGITDVADACLAAETCIAPLTGRRPVDASGQTTYFVSRTDFPEQFAGLAWRGGDAASLLWRYRVEDVPAVLAGDRLVGQLAAMVTPETAGGVVPALLGQPFALMVQDATGRQPQASLYPVERRNDGRFAAETTVITGDPGRFPQDLLVEDFDRDGHLDALVSNCASSQLLLRRGPLEDAAQPLHAIAALTCPRALAAGDLNSDGRVDVVSLLDLPAGISTRLGRGDGTFSLPVNLRMQRSPKALALADFDRDGHVDVLTGGLEPDCEPAVPPTEDCEDRPLSRLFLRWGRGLRGFDFQRAVHLPAHPNGAPLDAAGPGAEQLVVADLDLDGHPDVLAADGPTVRVFRGTGERAAPFDWFGPAADLDVRAGQRASAVAVGDIDGDARPDVVVTTRDDDDDPESAVHTGTVVVFLGQGNGAFVRFATIDSDERHDVHLGDATGDGYPDVLALDRTGALRRFVGRGDGRLTASTVTPLVDGAGRFRVADANRDGVEDLIGPAAARGAERLVLRRGLGRAAFGRARPPLPTGTGPVGLVALDFDHDGHLDLASLNEEASSLSLFRGDGAGGFTRAGGDVALEIAPADAVASDVTGDGRVDLVVTTGNGQARQVLRGTGAGLVALPSEITPGAGFGYFDPSAACYGPVFPRERLLAVDLDGDGTREILHGTGGVIERLSTYVADSVFDSERLPFGADCGAGFTVWDVDGRWRPVAYSAGTAAVDVSMPDGLLTLYGVRVGLAISELGQAAWRRVVDTGDVRGFVPFQIYGNGMDTTDFDADGRDELVLFGHVDDRRYSLVFHAPGHDVLTRGRLEASAIDGWYDKYEGQGVHRLAPRLADFNGDGLADEVGVIPELNVASLRLRRAYEIGYSPDDEVIPLKRAAPQGLEIGDANHDGVPDLFIANYFDDSLTTQVMPGPGEWTQTLADPMLVRAPLPAPGAVDFPLARMRQAFQMVDTISVYVDLEGEGLSAVELSLGAPDGRRVALGRGPAAGPWRAVFRGPAVDLSPLYGRQPTGDWTLWATVGDGAVGRLRDFRVVTHGAFVRAAPGATPARPRLLRFPGGATGRALRDTTLGGPDGADLTCADTGGGQPDRSFEGAFDVDTELSLQLAAGFDAALELRRGPCATPGPVLQCATGRSAHIGAVTVPAGAFCVIVDGLPTHGIQSGEFDLFARLDEAAPDPCANGACEPEPDAALPIDAAEILLDAGTVDAGVAGEVNCGGTPCREVCCVGFAGPRCGAGCGFLELPALCDGPEDCPGGQECCVDQGTGARCADACAPAQYTACHRDVECSEGTCIHCAFPGIGALDMCRVDACP